MWCKITVLSNLTAVLSFEGPLALESKSRVVRYTPEQQLSVGSILLVNEKLADLNLARSVILMVQYDPDEGTEGLVINRPTDVPLSRVFPNVKNAASDPVFAGGPVQGEAVQALLRLSHKTDHATAVGDGVYVAGAKDLIEKSIASRTEPSNFRIYLGYAGWAPRQLEAEVQLGAWSVLNPRADIVFDKDPETLWSRLTRESHMQIAELSDRKRLHFGVYTFL